MSTCWLWLFACVYVDVKPDNFRPRSFMGQSIQTASTGRCGDVLRSLPVGHVLSGCKSAKQGSVYTHKLPQSDSLIPF